MAADSLDLSAIKCQEFLDSGKDNIAMIITWLDGYYKDPQATATIDAKGWLRTGDLGSLDSNGHVSYTGRLKDMLKVGGENVAPIEWNFMTKQELIDAADLVTEMTLIKHPFRSGIKAQPGVEY